MIAGRKPRLGIGAPWHQGQFFYSFCLDDVVPADHRGAYASIKQKSLPRLIGKQMHERLNRTPKHSARSDDAERHLDWV